MAYSGARTLRMKRRNADLCSFPPHIGSGLVYVEQSHHFFCMAHLWWEEMLD